jgi:UDP-N-acetylenolpyruvoylglucosamine reductase
VKLGISGFEYLTELPGTVAAAIYNNSSCKSNSISALLESIDFLRTDGVIEVLRPDDLGFTYRNSLLKSKDLKGVILKVRLRRIDSDPAYLMSIAERNMNARKVIFDNNIRNLGCVFDNPRLSLSHRIILRLCTLFYRIVRYRGGSVDNFKKKILLRITGYSELEPYICDKSFIIFNWNDDDADRLFPLYCDFAKKVLNTTDLEIEIKK